MAICYISLWNNKEQVNDSRIKLKFGFVPDKKLQEYFRAANFVVLPFKDILNSGNALLALSFDCPVLVSALQNVG
ncbi:MAG: hypothetical protein SWX82_33215 [Cyanobacteriota bacterium]|nr:hypothetical protein [Cyanobacteriota bacterium]